ncbi:hypothetical protein CC1G_15712 [Coprinopsis cinerea okayama7|uniref:Uncharacterized protein n=1 Tax=Coprinopsis cinerea (strain Okayama-7 / 130 / ATCC MYA-4618 / FGSC 9003) TaxID=240176 RepID=D6RQH3_COPC7|nr:hypothetical protein CC1G_15712 [Coprinopsis cinerea okayama7\|eukprot:XP_002910283.1 hypothetical protein CC1G_15712 [Coprinopsis cinerea okayama7\
MLRLFDPSGVRQDDGNEFLVYAALVTAAIDSENDDGRAMDSRLICSCPPGSRSKGSRYLPTSLTSLRIPQ